MGEMSEMSEMRKMRDMSEVRERWSERENFGNSLDKQPRNSNKDKGNKVNIK